MYYFTLASSFIIQWASWIALLWFTVKLLTSKKNWFRKLIIWIGYYLLFLLINVLGQIVVAWINLQSPIFYDVIEASFGGITASATKERVMQEYLIQVAGFALYNSVVWQSIVSFVALFYSLIKIYRRKKTT